MMLFRLALALGKTVRTLENEIGTDELNEWIAYRNIEYGLPYEKFEYYLAQIALLIYLANSDGKRKVTIEDFMLKEKRKQTRNEMKIELLKLKGIARWQGRAR